MNNEQIRQEAEKRYPYVWPKNKHGEELAHRVGQTAPPNSRKVKNLQNAFIAGYQAGYNASPKGSVWVKASERLPPVNVEVEIKDSDGHVYSDKAIVGWDARITDYEWRIPETQTTETFTKDQVIDLLRQQRELCAVYGANPSEEERISNASSPLK